MTMNPAQEDAKKNKRQLRLWPGVVILVAQLLLRFVLPVVMPEQELIGLLGPPICTFAIVLWWLFLSRAAWVERLGALGLMIIGMFATSRLIDKSLATGAQGFLFPFLAIPGLGIALVLWAVATHRLSDRVRRITMVATILLACGAWAGIRTGGFTASDFKNDLHWRWTPTPEERLLARADELAALPSAASAAVNSMRPAATQPANKPADAPKAAVQRIAAAAPHSEVAKSAPVAQISKGRLIAKAASEPAPISSAVEEGPDWPGFRGPHRDGVVAGVRINADWHASPPVAIWRRPIGPGWSSFAVHGDRIYTQEQRGPDEVVACYELATGKPVWAHRDAARFWESNGGPGPRGTPTLSNGRVYTFGATGILNALNAGDGSVAWSRNAATDANMKSPGWGFASSPLVLRYRHRYSSLVRSRWWR
jgi:outer membrane protein assembly factor BamB